ncbi:MAG: thermonuclease family protein [Candidatus Devosia phytovorans]|uniref:Thermonuclease family protein n=1 Tax=Candidatus Devosia phytovorans TaxID=3121372 RepID=A0AAJ5VR79_9HYPH|nr:thermonuclease family protein [Devosia sp.]WEK02731.1 MAG: thermonuclease family protein [Devosia sp.]
MAALVVALDQPLPPVAGQARVSDGDSFRLGDERIRLLGMDAPELAQQCDTADGSKWTCGRSARDRMAELLSSGAVDCRPEGRDQYDRLLATCRVNDQDLGAIMVGEGLAVSSGGYWTEEAAARRDSRGIWAGSFDRPRDWRDDEARPHNALSWLGDLWP